ncbi:tetratricopeptide repeat protein [Nitrospira sp. Nam74]
MDTTASQYVQIPTLAVVAMLILVGANTIFEPDDCVAGGKSWQALAEHGEARAQFKLAACYERGQGVLQDYAEAIRWYRRAAAQGYQAAMWHLWDMYRRNRGIPFERQAAHLWLREAAQEGDAVAQYFLAEASMNGKYQSRDLVKAYMWLILSARQSFPPATYEQDLLATQLSPSQIAEAQRLAREHEPKKSR